MKLRFRVRTIAYHLTAIAMVASNATVAQSQTTLVWPDSRIDVSNYQWMEACLAANRRVVDSVRVWSKVAEDTMPRPTFGDTFPIAEDARASTQRCLARYSVKQIPLTDAFLAQRLYLIANEDDNAELVVQRRLRSGPPADTIVRAAVLDSTITEYLNAQPARIALAHSYLQQLEGIRDVLSIQRRAELYRLMTYKCKQYHHDELKHKYGEEWLAIAQNATEIEREIYEVRLATAEVIRIVYHDMLIDSIRKGNDAYARTQRAIIGRILGIDPSSIPQVIAGNPVAEIKGEFVYPEAARNDRFPRSGKVSVFLMVSSKKQGVRSNSVRNAILHRLKRAFPEIDIVLLAGTDGAIAPLAPMAPSDEAAMTNKIFREYQGIDATLLVSTTPIMRVPDPDRRVVPLQNPIAEIFLKQFIEDGAAFIVDSSSQIVEGMFLGDDSEQWLNEIIRAVLEREQVKN